MFEKFEVPEVLIKIVRSFHENMTAQNRLEGINMNNGLRQGCTIAPMLFNCMAEQWCSRIKNVEGV